MERFFSTIFIIILSPIIIVITFLIFVQDFENPFFFAERVGKNSKIFKLIKFRSMIIDARKVNIFSTSSNDKRITFIGKIIRKYKIDEIPQLLNILYGDITFVGPRPNVISDVNKYNQVEKKLLEVKPGITDIASIVFADEGQILLNSKNPDEDYNKYIRPWKSRLGLFYIKNRNIRLDLIIIILTLFSIFNRKKALIYLSKTCSNYTKNYDLINFILRDKELTVINPPEDLKFL